MRDTSLSSAVAERLLLKQREAADLLSVCEKSLWSLTWPRGPIRCVRIGRSVRYSPESLHEFIAQQQAGGDAASL